MHTHYAKLRTQTQTHDARTHREHQNDKLLFDKHQRQAYNKLKKQVPKQPSVLRNSQGEYVSHPEQVDKQMREAWDKVFQGNSSNHFKTIPEYYNLYQEHIYHGDQHEVPELTGEALKQACVHAQSSATGMDLWGPLEFALLSDVAFMWLVDTREAVENRGLASPIWPDDCEQLTLADIKRDTADRLDPPEGEVEIIDLKEYTGALFAGLAAEQACVGCCHDNHLLRRL